MKISKNLENIFAHAVALQQSGRLKSQIYCLSRKIYIMNQDQTILMRFRLRKVDRDGSGELSFKEPLSFAANDYDSNNIEERDGSICFITSAGGFERVKSCKLPSIRLSPEEVEELWGEYENVRENQITLHKDMLGLLDESLSHIEFSAEDGALHIIQRNIYTGTVLELTREESTGLLQDAPVEDFEPIGLRTNDFMALFSFVDSFDFYFQPGGVVRAESRDPKMRLMVIISKCKYDELGGTQDGREEQEDGGSE